MEENILEYGHQTIPVGWKKEEWQSAFEALEKMPDEKLAAMVKDHGIVFPDGEQCVDRKDMIAALAEDASKEELLSKLHTSV